MIKAKEGYYNSKSGEGMVAVDSAEWYIEAAINYTYNDMSQNAEEVTWKRDSATIAIDDEGKVDMLQLAEVYDGLIEGMVDEDEYLSIADITIKDDGDKASSKTVYLTAKTGLKNAAPPPPPVGTVSFENEIVWLGTWKDLETGEVILPYIPNTYCDPNIINSRGATDILETHVRNSYLAIALQPGQYWVTVETFFVHPPWDIDNPLPNEIWYETENEYLLENNNGNGFDWLIYRNFDGSSECLSIEELDWYINHGIFTLIERIRPENTEFAGIIASPEGLLEINYYWHTMRLIYGRVENPVE